jgi:hypothetical protein
VRRLKCKLRYTLIYLLVLTGVMQTKGVDQQSTSSRHHNTWAAVEFVDAVVINDLTRGGDDMPRAVPQEYGCSLSASDASDYLALGRIDLRSKRIQLPLNPNLILGTAKSNRRWCFYRPRRANSLQFQRHKGTRYAHDRNEAKRRQEGLHERIFCVILRM